VKFNYSHLKIHPPQVKFDKNTGEEEDKSRYMDSSWVALQKTICCLTAGQIVDTGKDVTTGESLVGAEAVKGAFEKIKYYNRHGSEQCNHAAPWSDSNKQPYTGTRRHTAVHSPQPED
jgi:hypothetical protein